MAIERAIDSARDDVRWWEIMGDDSLVRGGEADSFAREAKEQSEPAGVDSLRGREEDKQQRT